MSTIESLLADLRRVCVATRDETLPVYLVDLQIDVDDSRDLNGRLVLILAHLGGLTTSIALDVDEGERGLTAATKALALIVKTSSAVVTLLQTKPATITVAAMGASC